MSTSDEAREPEPKVVRTRYVEGEGQSDLRSHMLRRPRPRPQDFSGRICDDARRLLGWLQHSDPERDSAEARELLGDVLAAIEDRRERWPL